MMINTWSNGQRVKQRGHGTGVIIGSSRPSPSRFYVRVRWDSGREENAVIELLEPLIEAMQRECREKTEFFRTTPLFYEVAGMLLRSDVYLGISVPPYRLVNLVELLDASHIEYTLGKEVTISSDRSIGETFNISARDTGWKEKLSGYLTVNRANTNAIWLSCGSKPFLLGFLVLELGFSLGHQHNVDLITRRVPLIFRPAFDAGLAIGVSDD